MAGREASERPISIRQAASILTLWNICDDGPAATQITRLSAWLLERYGVESWRFLRSGAAEQAIAALDAMASAATIRRCAVSRRREALHSV